MGTLNLTGGSTLVVSVGGSLTLSGSGTLGVAEGGGVSLGGFGVLQVIGTGAMKGAALYNYVNVGVKPTHAKDAVLYNYVNVTNHPTQLFISDGVSWVELDTRTIAETRSDNTLRSAKDYTGLVVSEIKGLAPPAGNTGQVLEKMSGADYDYKWVTPTGGGSGGLPVGGTSGQVLRKNSGVDGDASWANDRVPTGGTTGQVLKKLSTSDYDLAWQNDTVSASQDARWIVPSGWTSIDEFTGTTIGGNWFYVDPTNGGSRAVWGQGNDVVSCRNTGGDAANTLHALMRPIGSTMNVGDAFVTCFTLMGPPGTNYSMGGLVLSDNATYGSGTQAIALSYTGTGAAQTNDCRGFTGYNTQNVSPAGSQTTFPGVRTFIRIVKTNTNYYRVDVSPDGVHWLRGSASANISVTPTHVGVLSSSWGTNTPHIVSYEFFRKQVGIT